MVRTIVELNNFIITCILNDCENPKNIKAFVSGLRKYVIVFTKTTISIPNYPKFNAACCN